MGTILAREPSLDIRLTSKVDSRTERIITFIMTLHP